MHTILRLAVLLSAPIAASIALVPSPAMAKDLNGRLGLGFMSTFGGGATGLTDVSLRYGIPTGNPKTNIAFELDVGVAIDAAAGNRTDGGARLLFAGVVEDNMNLYVGAGVGYTYDTTSGVGVGQLRVTPGIEAEFFPFGLENLGFAAGVGLNLGLGDNVQVTTVGGAPSVGMHYYF